jgi:hypothetical protein
MSKWFRFYDAALDDPKVQKLAPTIFKAWVNILCLASRNEGAIPPLEDVAFALRVDEDRAQEWIAALISAGLIDQTGNGSEPHNWQERQFKSDGSSERVKRFRERVASGKSNVSNHEQRNVSETLHETGPEQNRAESDTEKKIPVSTKQAALTILDEDPKAVLFGEAAEWLAAETGKSVASVKSSIGQILKLAGGDGHAGYVLGVVRDAKRERKANPIAWCMAMVKDRRPIGGGPPQHSPPVSSAFTLSKPAARAS